MATLCFIARSDTLCFLCLRMVRRKVCRRLPRFLDAKNRPKAGFLLFTFRSAQFFPGLPDQVEHSLDRIKHLPRHNLPDFTQAAALTTIDKLPARSFHGGLGLLSICALPVPQMPLPSLAQSTGKVHIDLDLRGVDWRIKSSLFAEGVQDGIFWVLVPLLTFEFAKSEVVLSGYLSLFAFWGAVMTVALGYLSDRLKDRAYIVRVGAAFGAISIMFAAQAQSAEEYLSAMSIAFLWIAMIPSFLFTMLVDKMEKFKRKGVLIREFFLNGGRCAGVLVVVLAIVSGAGLNLALMVSAVALASIIIVK